jgi:hypothetical protein
MAQGGIAHVTSPFKGVKAVKVVNISELDGEVIFPRVLVADLNTKTEFWVHLGFNDTRNHTSTTYAQLVKPGEALEVKGLFSMKNFWYSYGDPKKEIPSTAINESFRVWRPSVLRIWESPLTKSEKLLTKASEEDVKKRRIFWVVQDSHSGGGGSTECCYWS